MKGKFVQKESHNIDTMEQIMQRKEQEFIDQVRFNFSNKLYINLLIWNIFLGFASS